VRDTGPGIPDKQREQVFNRFYQTETGSNHADAGTGIGLALVRELVTLHRGRIALASAVGWRTTFSVYLRTGTAHFEERPDVRLDPTPFVSEVPVLTEEDTAGPGVHSAASGLGEGSEDGADDSADDSADDGGGDEDRLTILVVDDNAEVRAFVRQHLRPHYLTVEAGDGRVGLDKARALTPDLILSDVMMPEMDGNALCRAVKQDPELDFIPVILLTAKVGSEAKLEGLEGGADDYLTKPFNMAELKTRIANLIALRQRLRERFQATGTPPSVPALDVKSTDDVFREGVRAAVEAHLADESFGVEALAEVVGMDRSHLYRRMKEAIGQSPSAYLLAMRLEQAAGLLLAGAGTVSEIAYGVGFRSVPYFTTAFRKRYGCTPTQYSG
jgi:CheY-like chemotaxis protein